jgi:hypothetical protein
MYRRKWDGTSKNIGTIGNSNLKFKRKKKVERRKPSMGIYLILDRLIDSTNRCLFKRTNNRPLSFLFFSQAVLAIKSLMPRPPLPPEDGVHIYI